MGHAGVVRYERLWERLLKFLASWAEATVLEPGRIELTVGSSTAPARKVQILMTPSQWDDMVTIPFGDFDAAAAWLKRTVLRPPHEPFLVYDCYDLHPSPTPELPDDPDDELLARLAREHPEGIGNWAAIDQVGTVHPFPELPPER